MSGERVSYLNSHNNLRCVLFLTWRPPALRWQQVNRFGQHRRDQGNLLAGLFEFLRRQADQIHRRVTAYRVEQVTQSQRTVESMRPYKVWRYDDNVVVAIQTSGPASVGAKQ